LARLETGHRGAELEPLFRLLTALGLTLSLNDAHDADDDARDSGHGDGTGDHDGNRTSRRSSDLTRLATPASAAQSPAAAVTSASRAQDALGKYQAAAAGRRRAWENAAALLQRGRDDEQSRANDDTSHDPADHSRGPAR
jgi:hypothetical protein